MLAGIQAQLRSLVGLTAFESLARAWVDWAGQSGQLTFEAERIGSFWSRTTQVDVVAVNWPKKQILLGECKWGAGQIEPEVLQQLIDKKSALVLQALPAEGAKWAVSYALNDLIILQAAAPNVDPNLSWANTPTL